MTEQTSHSTAIWQSKAAWAAERSVRRNPLIWVGALLIVVGGIAALIMNHRANYDAGISAIASSLTGGYSDDSAVAADYAGMWFGLVTLFIGVAVVLTGIIVANIRRASA